MVGAVRKHLPEPIALGLVLGVPSAHPMGLVNEDQIPLRTAKTFDNLGALGPVQGRDDLVLVLPRVGAIRALEIDAAKDVESLAESIFHLSLPLEHEVGGGDDQDAAHQPAHLQLLQEKSGHDRLAGACVVRQ